MKTTHKMIFKNAAGMDAINQQSIDLVVTSPPYPMIGMWDDQFCSLNPDIKNALDNQKGLVAFELMHKELDKVWRRAFQLLNQGGIACINIGDATRTIDGDFMLYPNHSRIISAMIKLGFSMLPPVIWRKQTNAPNKFMGSGMMPPGAYVTYEHEYVLIFRKGGKRLFKTQAEKANRRQSAYFWEERNTWFSDIWMSLKGARQNINHKDLRKRSAAFPFELAYRLINMFSAKGDTVLDPFVGTGTTLFSAMAASRNSIGYELEADLKQIIHPDAAAIVGIANRRIENRLQDHIDFVKERNLSKGPMKYTNMHYGFQVMTRQEKELLFHELESVTPIADNTYEVGYQPLAPPKEDQYADMETIPPKVNAGIKYKGRTGKGQLKLF